MARLVIVLIPRPETEELVDYILSSKILRGISEPKILDVGAGTGAIGIALLSKLPTAACYAIDINEVAVELANENAMHILTPLSATASRSSSVVSSSSSAAASRINRYNCELISFLDFISSGKHRGKYDLIVSNPPYIPSDEMLELEPEVKNFEDHRALYGGDDGLSIVRDIILHSKQLLRPNGPGEIWMEVARRHPKAIEELMKGKESGLYGVDFDFVEGIVDMSGNPRFVRLRAKATT